VSVDPILGPVERYYTAKVVEHGATAQGVDWNSQESQELRFAQLLEVVNPSQPFSITDYGCGYGALVAYMNERDYPFTYRGFDISEGMIDRARQAHGHDRRCEFFTRRDDLEPGDYAVASGIFNVRLEASEADWLKYILETIRDLDRLGTKGFAFNSLTRYSDADRMRDNLYYADPLYLFDHCKVHHSKWVALLHDYGLYEFTIVVRKDV
jgi:SAM-dependent methyltransferase